MLFPLLSAEPPDTSNTSALLVLLTLGVILIAAALTCLPILVARSRRHRRAEVIASLAILWGLLAAGSVIMNSMDQAKWSREQTVRIQSGYYDPRDNADAPAKPIGLWIALTLGYAVLIAWPLLAPRAGIVRSADHAP